MYEHPRLLVCSYHGFVDPSSGAALSLHDLLVWLGRRDWDCRVLCGPQLDFKQETMSSEVLFRAGLDFTSRLFDVGPCPFQLFCLLHNGIPITMYQPRQLVWPPSPEQAYAFLALLQRALELWRPDLLLTYGGTWIGRAIIACAKRMGIRVVFWLRNCSYQRRDFFDPIDAIFVPCQFSRAYYHKSLGLQCIAIPSPVDPSRVRCDSIDRTCVTFVNPQLAKGAAIFARITMDLQRLRPDIPFLVVEGRARAQRLADIGLDIAKLPNVRVMPNAIDPRDFYRVTRLLLMPSLWEETFARVPVEAFINSVPVLATRRGGLPENLAGAGFLFDLPEKYFSDWKILPSSKEVEPWVRTIVRLFDEPEYFEDESRRCVAAAEEFSEGRLSPRYDGALREALSCPPKPIADDVDILHVVASYMQPSSAASIAELHPALLEKLLLID